MKTVVMPIHKKWFDMILYEDKKEEYRKIGDYWRKRLLVDKVDRIKFVNGYGKNKPFLVVELKDIRMGTGKEEWGAVPGENYYILELGEKITYGNIKVRAMVVKKKNKFRIYSMELCYSYLCKNNKILEFQNDFEAIEYIKNHKGLDYVETKGDV